LPFSLLPPPYIRPPLPALYLVRPLFCSDVPLFLFLILVPSRYLELSIDVGVDGTASVAVFVPRSPYYLPTVPPTCVAAAIGTWPAVTVHRLVVLKAGVPAVAPREIKESRINEQCARAASWSTPNSPYRVHIPSDLRVPRTRTCREMIGCRSSSNPDVNTGAQARCI